MRISDWSSDVCSSDLNIRVNAIVPGNVQTERQQQWYSPEGEAEIVAAQCLNGRIQPADIAAMALFLASDEGRFCTAHNYLVDAGWRCSRPRSAGSSPPHDALMSVL